MSGILLQFYELWSFQSSCLGWACLLYTSALDPETAAAIEEMVLSLKDVMVLHISHKPSMALRERYDAVLTMEGGRLAQLNCKEF